MSDDSDGSGNDIETSVVINHMQPSDGAMSSENDTDTENEYKMNDNHSNDRSIYHAVNNSSKMSQILSNLNMHKSSLRLSKHRQHEIKKYISRKKRRFRRLVFINI